MTRAYRLRVEGGIFHLTHRCHNRAFLLKLARDREAYREKMRGKLRSFKLSLLDYCLTCNHVHLIVDAQEMSEVSRFMREVAGEFARAYNRRNARCNAVWGDNFHATSVDSGSYLWRCLCYVELNMVRCGVVAHPEEWRWQGGDEIMGRRRRYRLLDLERLCWRLGTDRLEEVREHFKAAIHQAIARDEMKREPCWTESLAVGSREFVEQTQPLILSRQDTQVVEEPSGLWHLKDVVTPYLVETGLKSGSKP